MSIKDPGLNSVIISGKVMADPELRYLSNSNPVAKFRVGITERYKQGDEWKRKSHYTEVKVWGKYAELCVEKIGKDDYVVVVGRLNYEEWEKDGRKQNRLGLIASSMESLAWPEKNKEESKKAGLPAGDEGRGDDIPF